MWRILMCVIRKCISWPCNNYAFCISFFVTFKLPDFSLPKWRETLSLSIFISHDNPELPHTRYSFIYCVKFSRCRHSNLNWRLVAIHQEKTCNLETLLQEMLTGIGPYVCWSFLFNSNEHYVLVASVEGCTDCHGPVCMWKIFLWKVFRSVLNVCGSICGKCSIKF